MGNIKTKTKAPDVVDGPELHQRRPHTPYRPGTADAKKKKKAATQQFLDGPKVDVLNSWVSTHIKKKECVAFITRTSEEPDVCGCGHTRKQHHGPGRVTEMAESPGASWDPHKHVREFPSDSHGDLTFTGINRMWAKYVRASCDTNPSVLCDLMTQQWGLSMPSLLISVTGGAKNFNISPRLKNQFSRGLVKAAQSTGAWIITGGSHAGVMKHVGEAIRDFSGDQLGSEIVLIGIATWGIVHNREYLLSAAGGAPALYPMDEGSQGSLCCLDNNHTHFILVDDGTHGKYGVEIPLRIRLERYISQQTMNKGGTALKIPIVCVVLEGGPGTLDTIYSSMSNNTPCVIVEGSGRVADIIAQVANISPSRITISLIKDKLRNLFQDTYDGFTETQIIMWTKKIQDIVRMGSLLTILREEKVGDQGMDVAILQALLKASHSTDHYGQENWDHQLKLAVSWNRPDIAKTQIFTEDWTWKPSDLYPCLTLSLIEDKPLFVRLFLEHGVSLSEYVTWDTLTYLYKNTDPSSLISSKLERAATGEGSRIRVEPTIELHHVSRVLQELLGDISEPLYPEGRHRKMRSLAHVNIKMNGKVSVMKKSKPPQYLAHPVRDLLIWCIVQNRQELADIIWSLSDDCIVGALACTKILKALAKEEEDTENIDEMKALADVYEERAIGVFSECDRYDQKRAELLLIRMSPKWGKTTTLELAEESQARSFMSQGGVQMFLTKTWWGRLSVDNGFIQIMLCMLLFPLIYSGLITYRKGYVANISGTEGSTNERQSMRIRHELTNSRRERHHGPKPYSCFWKFMAFFNAPIIKFYYNVVSYIGFLWLFAYVIMIDFQPSPSWREYILYVWVFTILCEELRQLLYDPDHHGFVSTSIQYISGFWNQVDTAALGLFIVGLICRLVTSQTVYLGRVFLSLDFIIFCVRFMHIFTVSRVLGPKIIILRQMVKDIFFFLFLLAIWIVSYGVALQAITTINEDRLYWIFRNVLYGPYLTLFGQMPSIVDSLNFDPTKCSMNGTNPSQPKCVYNDGDGNALFPEWLTIILMCLYLLMANILLLNLLIAMFSYTFADIESNTDEVWKFMRYNLIKEYNERPTAPTPFILFSHIYIVLKYVVCKRSDPGHKVLRRLLDEGQESSLLSWESYMRDNYQQMKQQQEGQSQENLVKETAQSLSTMMRLFKVEKGSMGHHLETRLTTLEDQMAQSSRYLNWIISALTEKGFSSKTRIIVHSNSTESEDKAAPGSETTGEKCLYHVNARILQYPNSNVLRFPVPDELVPWEVEFPDYTPPLYNAERYDRGTYNPTQEMQQNKRKYNAVDGMLDFRSCLGTYRVENNSPLNPMGRTGLSGVGSLRWFGPNHSLHPVLTRWSINKSGAPNKKMSRRMLEVLVVKLRGNEMWALPGGTLDPGEQVPLKFQPLLKRGYLSEFLALLGGGTEVFLGYLDDPRNTDNAWIETLAINIHFDSKESNDRFLKNLKESDFEVSLRWQLLDHKIPLYANEKEILQLTAELHNAHY
ncbi:transient receptor potential cation channel subfamily M member 2-like [Hyla sarda]|uniref:transient receptor potential cation channel subfamily M member 2-like n=1 Tax=Hyla sarda TaxID=327740 RepID=UPI0024C252F5|nr:transient receptor potential cation channel subfamily M member 2-like [Hyla sarda]